ncbi:MAG: MGMT family protein [Cyanobacteria bacterium P01_H01_bin.15]
MPPTPNSETKTTPPRSLAYSRIYDVVRQIPEGKVATYGQVARLAQLPRHARMVGYALFRVDMKFDDIPWHRVVNAKGEISYSLRRHGSDFCQKSLLQEEGIVFDSQERINLRTYAWEPPLALFPDFPERVDF